jgi:glycosyltransferase involved in cell wall biosynthesis
MNHEKFQEQYSVLNQTSRNKRIAINRAEHVRCVSENTKRDLMSIFNTDERKISVIHLGFDSAQKNLPDALNPICKKPVLLFVGHRSGYKNFSSFLKAVANSKRLIKDFDLIAFGGGKFTKLELDLIKSLGFTDNQVKQISGGDDLLNQSYRQATAFVHPSVYEGFGIPPLEAMAQQCPVISSNSSSMPEVIGQAAEFFSPMNLEEMQYAIENVVYSKERTQELITNGLSRIQDFSWQKCAKETLSVYNTILGIVR